MEYRQNPAVLFSVAIMQIYLMRLPLKIIMDTHLVYTVMTGAKLLRLVRIFQVIQTNVVLLN